MKLKLNLLAILFAWLFACAQPDLRLVLKYEVPEQFYYSRLNVDPPSGEPEPLRYTVAYEAFWWNCVMVKAVTANARCPMICSGTPGAAWGGGHGAVDAEDQIAKLLKKFPASRVQNYLQSIASEPEVGAKVRRYFPDGPRSDGIYGSNSTGN